MLLDLTLPGTDGWKLWEQLEATRADRPLRVILFSASLSAPSRAAAAARGVSAILAKPVSGEALRAAVRRALAEVGRP